MAGKKKKKELVDNLVKAEIVETVLALIKEEQSITMDEIARRCSVAKGTLYNYFKDKKALMQYVHHTVLFPIKDSNKAIFEKPGDPTLRLHEFIDSAFCLPEDVSLYFRFVQQKRTVANQIDERFEVVMRPLIRFCRQGIQEGFFIDVDPFVLAEMIYGTVIGSLISMQIRGDGTLDKKKIDKKKMDKKQMDKKQMDIEKIKQDIIRLVDRITLPSRRKK